MADRTSAYPPPYPGQPPLHGHAPPVTNQPAYVVYPAQATVIQRPIVPVVAQQIGYEPCIYTCKSCNLTMTTRVERSPACRTHTYAGLLFLFGCWPCACFPYCMNACNNADHYCTHCGSYIGSYSPH